MLSFFRQKSGKIYGVEHKSAFSERESAALSWLFEGAELQESGSMSDGYYIGPRPELITPWSTTAVEITQTMGIEGITRVETFTQEEKEGAVTLDPMLNARYHGLDGNIFAHTKDAEPIRHIEDIEAYNESAGLALSNEEIDYLKKVSKELGRPLTDSELFGFSQVNSEHCRHKIFNGTFVIDGEEKPNSLFQMIKSTSKANPELLVSAYKDNVAFQEGPAIKQFAPDSAETSGIFVEKEIDAVLSLKAETHNFPTTVEPFNGAATGTGGEIRDRLAGGKASIPLAGTAVYMSSYTRIDDNERAWESLVDPRAWLYQSPQQILTKASNGASDFGNKFGQPLICGSVLTFEHEEGGRTWGYDKAIMLAGGVGYANKRDALKEKAEPGEKVIVMGGDNYRIGMGGGAVSSVNTGEMANRIELNAVQRSNPEMQKRVANVIRALAESDHNPVISIHDHGAGGHLNCLSELVEETGGHIDMDRLPVGDPTLSAMEIIGNESQERMGLLVHEEDVEGIRKIAEREKAPFYVVGETTNDERLVFEKDNGDKPIDLALDQMFGSAPKTYMRDTTKAQIFTEKSLQDDVATMIDRVMRLDSVGCKDWLTNKVDRSVTGRVARQQCCGELQLPLSDLGAMALDFTGKHGIATSIGHAPITAMIDPAKGSRLAIAEALTNIVGAPLEHGLGGVMLSANWMWPCRNEGEDARLYNAVEACAEFAKGLGVTIPTGKDSLSMTQKYTNPDRTVLAPGTVIISAASQVTDIKAIVDPVIKKNKGAETLIHVDFSGTKPALGGSALFQTYGLVGDKAIAIQSSEYFASAFEAVNKLVQNGKVLAIHDISAGGLLTTLLEMTYANTQGGLQVALDVEEPHAILYLFAENPGVVIQVYDADAVLSDLKSKGVVAHKVAQTTDDRHLRIQVRGHKLANLDIDALRKVWFDVSSRMETFQSNEETARDRKENRLQQPVHTVCGDGYQGTLSAYGKSLHRTEKSGVRAAIVRDKGTNGEREMAYVLHLAGFDVKDIHMTDLIEGRENLEDVQMLVFCGGFSNSDVLGSAKGWAAGFLYNERAKATLDAFYARKDTLSLGVCNGCQLLGELGFLDGEHEEKFRLTHNASGRFESAFVSLTIPENNSVMLSSLAGRKLGTWVAHGEGRFVLSNDVKEYHIAAQYDYDVYPGNPNKSPAKIAALTDKEGRHLAIMPHPERSIFPWQCGFYPYDCKHEVTPWFEAFVNAFNWCKEHR